MHKSSTQNQEGQSHFLPLKPKSVGRIDLTGQIQMILQSVDITSGNNPDGVSESQHHTPSDPGPHISEQIEWVVRQALDNVTEREKPDDILIKHKDKLKNKSSAFIFSSVYMWVDHVKDLF